jgi:hypothetical protein
MISDKREFFESPRKHKGCIRVSFDYLRRCNKNNNYNNSMIGSESTAIVIIIIVIIIIMYNVVTNISERHAVAQLVEALRYKPEGRGFNLDGDAL